MDIININALLAKGAVVTTLEDGDWFVLSRTSNGQLAGPNPTGGYPLLAISKNDLAAALGGGGSTPIALDLIPKGTGPGITNGTWKFSGNDILPVTSGSNIGSNTNRIGTVYLASVFDYSGTIDWYNGTSSTMNLTTGGHLAIGVMGAAVTKLEVAADDFTADFVSTRYENGNSAPAGFAGRRANGTQAGPSGLLTDNEISAFSSYGYELLGGWSNVTGAAIFVAAENFTAFAHGTYFKVGTTAIGSTTKLDHFFVTSEGLVGIGTATPSVKLEVNGDVKIDRYLYKTANTNNQIDFNYNGGSALRSDIQTSVLSPVYIDIETAGDHYFKLTGAGRLLNLRGDILDFYQSANGMGSAFNVTYANSANDTKAYFYSSLGATYLGVGTQSPNPTAVLDLTSTTQGFLPPRMTTTQRTAIVSPPEGLIVYDTDLHLPYYFNGTIWVSM